MSFFPVELIRKKRDGGTHSKEEVDFLVAGYSRGEIPDYQMSSWLMAALLRGLDAEETHHLTEAMLHSGKVMDFSWLQEPKVDKHSTGGVGDKTSLILGPIAAAAGIAVPMISGRGLGHTGGTLDKLESIPGFNTRLSEEKFNATMKAARLCFMGQTDEICPADKKIYSLRDVSGSIESMPLICASIMSKKLAEGIDGLVLDVKYGSGAFMKNETDSEKLAHSLRDIGRRAGKDVNAVITNMDQPLGRFAGNSLEVEECLRILRGEKLTSFEVETRELSVLLAGHMVWLGRLAPGLDEGMKVAENTLSSGKALEKFEQVVHLQGGRLDDLAKAKKSLVLGAERDGFISSMNTEAIGFAAIAAGAGRLKSSDSIDPSAGFDFHVKIGDRISQSQPLVTIYGNDEARLYEAKSRLQKAILLGDRPGARQPLVKKTIS